MILRWFSEHKELTSFETNGEPPLVGQRVYVTDASHKRRVFIVERVSRSIAVAPVGLEVIRPELTKESLGDRFTQALRIAESMYPGVAKMARDMDRVEVWQDRAEITLKLDEDAFQDD